ncbi:DUF3817 domain-containing protein [Acaricomes phytoseiuli]|uniref:DUF3817 domain-containing protein n=1 Tax=Acaricomes phytoseiuli TaxID=291968 RepID=UPI00037BA438|nr:DUF3817 domain-containing protein [Acaricomes phytoseiuli]MCW1250098.1 DUF3817 domain-containing protein [Acaricomes phytoseiuli]
MNQTPTSGGNSPESAAAAKPTPRRRFGGTTQQIRSALMVYRVLAYATGIMLLLLTAEVILRYAFGLVLAAGGTDIMTGEPHFFGFVTVDQDGSLPLTGTFNISLAVLIVHGWMYVLYLLADFRLWSLMRWSFGKFILIALGGVVPLLSFFMERRVYVEARADLAAHPQAPKRY